MAKQCVFRCSFNGRRYSVLELEHPKREGSYVYQTMVGRKKLDSFTWARLGAAIGSILDDVDRQVIDELIEVWQ